MVRWQAQQCMFSELNSAGIGLEQAHDAAQQACFACAIAPDHSDCCASLKMGRNIPQYFNACDIHTELLQCQHHG
jgi:hypothetical protein